MSPPLPTVGSGEPVSSAVAALEKAGAAVVHVDGKPAGLLTRQDLLTFLAGQIPDEPEQAMQIMSSRDAVRDPGHPRGAGARTR